MAEKLKIKRFSRVGNMVFLETPNLEKKETWFHLSSAVQEYCKKNNISDGNMVEITYEKSNKQGDASTINFLKGEGSTQGVDNSSKSNPTQKYNPNKNVAGVTKGCAMRTTGAIVGGMGVTDENFKKAIKDVYDYCLSLLNG